MALSAHESLIVAVKYLWASKDGLITTLMEPRDAYILGAALHLLLSPMHVQQEIYISCGGCKRLLAVLCTILFS